MTDYADLIRSPENKSVKLIRSLGSRSRREAERAFLVEGVRAVEDALAAGSIPTVLLMRSDAQWFPAVEDLPVRWAIPSVFNPLCETENPQGVIGVFPMPELGIDADGTPLVLILDRVTDPGNLGSAIRSAAGAGGTAVLLTPGSVDPYNSKVVRAGMGAHFRIPIRWTTDLDAEALLSRCGLIAVAEADGSAPYDHAPMRNSIAFVVGSEAHGVSAEWSERAQLKLTIPLAGSVESLNAAVAASVLLFEAARQRRNA